MTTDTLIEKKSKIKIKEPSKYNVIIYNDEVTPFDFVISLLISVFKHDVDSADTITMKVHNEGSGVAGCYNFEIAEAKLAEATAISRNNQFPLQLTINKI